MSNTNTAAKKTHTRRKFVLRYQAGKGSTIASTETVTYARGTREALNKADKIFGLHRVRFLTHPSAKNLGAAYDLDGRIVGQVTTWEA